MDIRFLNHPLYLLHSIEDVTQFTELNEPQKDALMNREQYIADNIKEALRWAVQHPEFNFMEFNKAIRHSNKDIYDFLCKVAKSLNVV